IIRDCRHDTRDGQRLQTHYRRWSDTADILQEMVRDCRHAAGVFQRWWTCCSSCWKLGTCFKRWSKTGGILYHIRLLVIIDTTEQ
ncbi:unnamed protein product, partial [Staurois parvus]